MRGAVPPLRAERIPLAVQQGVARAGFRPARQEAPDHVDVRGADHSRARLLDERPDLALAQPPEGGHPWR
eukprot:5580703-Alexandrium_andersonii.AAC.1